MISANGTAVSQITLQFDIPVMIGVVVACLPIFFTGHLIARWEGGLFFVYFCAYTIYLVLSSMNSEFTRTFGIGLNMLRAQSPREKQTPEEIREGTEKEDIAIIPLAIPMLSGPGAISTVIVLGQHAHTWLHTGVLLGVILLTCILSYIILRSAAWVTGYLRNTGLRIASRLMGLLLAVIAVQFILNGVGDALPKLLSMPSPVGGAP